MNNDTQDLSKSEYVVLVLVLSSAIPSSEYRREIVKGRNNEVNLLLCHLGDQICVKQCIHLDLGLYLSTTTKKSLELAQDPRWVCPPGIKPPKRALTCVNKSLSSNFLFIKQCFEIKEFIASF